MRLTFYYDFFRICNFRIRNTISNMLSCDTKTKCCVFSGDTVVLLISIPSKLWTTSLRSKPILNVNCKHKICGRDALGFQYRSRCANLNLRGSLQSRDRNESKSSNAHMKLSPLIGLMSCLVFEVGKFVFDI